MSDDKIDLSRRKVLGGLATLGVAGAASGAGTFALFSDRKSSSGNTMAAGTIDLKINDPASFPLSLTNLAPGQTTTESSTTLENTGSLDSDHAELTVSNIANDDRSGAGNSATRFQTARRLFFTELMYGGNEVGFQPDALQSLATHRSGGAFLFDFGGSNGTVDVRMSRDAPSSNATASGVHPPTEPGGVVHVTSGGTSTTDYAISMRGGLNVSLSGIADGDISFKYYDGSNNQNSTADEVWVVVTDGGGTDHLLWRHKADPTGTNVAAQTWMSRDVAAELQAYKPDSFHWNEVGGSLSQAPTTAYSSGHVKAVGFGRGDTGTGRILDTYYADLEVNGSIRQFRPMSLYDLSRGVIRGLPGISAGGNEDFAVQFQLDELAGNAFQGQGVDVTFEFGLAQKSGQQVL